MGVRTMVERLEEMEDAPPVKFNFPAVYNPANQTKEELIANFVVRLEEFTSIFHEIKEGEKKKPIRHFIIQGVRGSGKTTLLLRLFHAVADDNALKEFLIPVIFDEEQYNIRTLSRLWEEIALYLEEEHESLFHGLYDDMQKYLEEDGFEETCYNLLKNRLTEKKRKLVLLVDNFGRMLSKFPLEEHRRLRERLELSDDIRIVGGSSIIPEYFHDQPGNLSEFFYILPLEGLDQRETVELLLQLSKTYNAVVVKSIVQNNPGRVEALRRLTHGVPRTIILLFEIFLDNEKGDSFNDLEIILDRVTPLYIHRIDSLPPQKQDIVDAIAMSWDAVGVKEIARKTRVPGKSVSAQLNELEKNKIIVKIPTSTKNNLYQVAERFFNIWYLMRHGRKRDRNKVLWLVRFLESWCSEEELVFRALKHIVALRVGDIFEKHAFYMTEALAGTKLPGDIQHQMIEETREYLTRKKSSFVRDISRSDIELYGEALGHYKNKEYDLALKKFQKINDKNYISYTYIALIYFHTKRDKAEALGFAKKAMENDDNYISANIYAITLLWNNEIEKAVEAIETFMDDEENPHLRGDFESILLFLLVKKQFYFTHKLFKENKFDIKDRYKPFYYVLMHFMRDTYPDEYRKMGPELKETVEEIIEKVDRMAIDYQ